MRPRLRHDVLFADTGSGVLFRNSENGFIVQGRTAYRFAAMLAPHLTGHNSVRELSAGLSSAQRTMVLDFVRALLDRGFVRDSRPSGASTLPEPVARHFRSQLDYVEHYVDDAAGRFAAFRNADVLVLGTDQVAEAATLSLLRNGLRTVHTVLDEPAAGAVRAEAARLTEQGCEAEVRSVAVQDLDPVRYDLVIACGLGADAGTVLRTVRAPRRGIVLPATSVGDLLVAGPLLRPGTTPCWTCALLRLGDNEDPAAIAELWRGMTLRGAGPDRPSPRPPVAAMFGTMLGYEAFRTLTGCLPAETEGAVIVQDRLTLETARDPLLPHPGCPDCGPGEAEIVADGHARVLHAATGDLEPERPEPRRPDPESPDPERPLAASEATVTPETLRDELIAIQDLLSEHVGVFGAFDDSALDQSPLKVTRLRAGSTADPAAPARLIAAADLHYVPRARTRAMLAAALAYVARSGPGAWAAPLDRPGSDAVPLDRLVTWTGRAAGDRDAGGPWLAATSLLDGSPRHVPAAAVHPFSPANAALHVEPAAAGDGAGTGEAEAIRQGLLSALAYEALREAATGAVAETIDVTAAPDGSEIDFLVRTARNLELTVELVDLAPGRPAHLVLARTTGDDPDDGHEPVPWAVGAALSRDAAVTIALRDLIAAEQLRRALGETDAVDFGDPLFPALDPRAIRSGAPGTSRPETTVAALLDDLRARDLDALVVPTTTSDLLRHGHLVTVRVLLARGR
ncbi:TOMM precursor leader peptide-binding protein [Actinomadura spongiicola]|uniref:TOMM precursor leader peptide-binding protein n=1 Tax=Actinomadura spongiicola TaxID=2303421 RepID=UPI0011C12224|nr:TOMM precursor leader peptide-binding protein [Actinomadura spongiicola]